jgi:hypothetical protein
VNLTSSQVTKLGLALGVCFAAYKFVSNPMVKSAAVAVGAVIIAKNAPITGPALS